MRLRISHSTTYRYEPAATGVIQIIRMTPGSHDGQYVAEWQIDLSTDSRLDMHEDAFGNVTHVITHGAIADLTITAEGLIETHDTGGVLRGADERFPPSLFLRATPLTAANPAMTNFVRELRGESEDDVLGFLHALMTQINEHMTFDEDPTNSGTIGGGGLRAQARRLPGLRPYLHRLRPRRAASRPASSPATSCAPTVPCISRPAMPGPRPSCPVSAGSASIPANCICTTDAHARIAIGLDYLGAAPVRGTRYGGGMETLTVKVIVDQAGRGGQSQSQSAEQS